MFGFDWKKSSIVLYREHPKRFGFYVMFLIENGKRTLLVESISTFSPPLTSMGLIPFTLSSPFKYSAQTYATAHTVSPFLSSLPFIPIFTPTKLGSYPTVSEKLWWTPHDAYHASPVDKSEFRRRVRTSGDSQFMPHWKERTKKREVYYL